MRYPRFPILALAVAPLFVGGVAATAQTPSQKDNDILAAAVKAALYIQSTGEVPVQPATYFLWADISVGGKSRAETQAELNRQLDMVRKVLSRSDATLASDKAVRVMRSHDGTEYEYAEKTPEEDKPEDRFRMGGTVNASFKTATEARSGFAALRAAKVSGVAKVGCQTEETDGARIAALKSAMTKANAQVKALGESVKPKEFDLVYIKTGDLKTSAWATPYIALQGTEPLPEFPTMKVSTTATIFYGFKPTVTAPKPARAMTTEPRELTEPTRVVKD